MSAKRQRQTENPKKKKKRASQSEEEKNRERGLPSGGKGRKDVIGRTSVFPVSMSEGRVRTRWSTMRCHGNKANAAPQGITTTASRRSSISIVWRLS